MVHGCHCCGRRRFLRSFYRGIIFPYCSHLQPNIHGQDGSSPSMWIKQGIRMLVLALPVTGSNSRPYLPSRPAEQLLKQQEHTECDREALSLSPNDLKRQHDVMRGTFHPRTGHDATGRGRGMLHKRQNDAHGAVYESVQERNNCSGPNGESYECSSSSMCCPSLGGAFQCCERGFECRMDSEALGTCQPLEELS